ncbi:MAG: helix-turn-helix domain-containing protein [Promethearchaeota archaeon]
MNEDKLSLARIKIRFPEEIWISQVFKEFKDVHMEIFYFLPYDLEKSIGNAVVEIKHFKIDGIIEKIKSHPSVHAFDILEREENRVRFNVKTRDPFLLYAVIKCGVLIDFPVRVKENHAYWKLIAQRTRIMDLLHVFDEKNIEYELLRIGNAPSQSTEEKNRLNAEEEYILKTAIETGFFEIPRRISLEDLARKLNKSKSSLSVSLRKIIKKKVLTEY